MKILKKRSLWTVILSAICALLLGLSLSMVSNLTSRAASLKSANDLPIGELTVNNYNSSNGSAVFSGSQLSKLYDALTGTNDGTATINKVAAMLDGNHSGTYGYSVPVTLPEYKTAADLYAMNGNKNIVVTLAGQEFAVSFLTKDMNGHVIATLWMTQPLKDASNASVKGKFGWASATYNVNYNSTTLVSYTSNAYATSGLRMAILNAGPTNASATQYAMGSGNSNVTALGQTVSTAERLSNVLAPFTLDNTALSSTAYANKSLINYITTPSQVKYTYYLDWPYASGSKAGTSYILNEALSRDSSGNFTLSGNVGNSDTNFYTANKVAHKGYWWNKGVYNYAASTVNHYNEWGGDYIWLPSLSETGYYTSASAKAAGLWCTGDGVNRQTAFGAENQAPGSSALAATTNSDSYVWLRSGVITSPSNSQALSSSGGITSAFTGATLAVRPALHLDLTSAAQAAVSDASATDGYELPKPQNITEDYTGSAQWLTQFAAVLQTGSTTEKKYKWIDLDLHNDSTVVTIKKVEYKSKNSVGTAATTATDITTGFSSALRAGTYEITLELAAGYKWRDQALVANDATSRQTTFTVTVNQLDLKYELKYYDQSGNAESSNKSAYTGDPVEVKYVPESTISGSKVPDVTVYYKGSGNNYGTASDPDGNVDDSTKGLGSANGPVNAGNYVAAFLDAETATDYKLVPKTTGGQTLSFQITKAQVSLPTVTTTTQTYNGNAQGYVLSSAYDKDILEVSGIKVTSKEGGSSKNYTLTYNAATGKFANSDGNYEAYIDDSTSTVKVYVTDAGDYTLTFGLIDTDNSEWASGVASDKEAKFTLNRAAVDVTFGAPGSTGFSWKVGDTGNLTLSNISNIQGSDDVTVKLYWYKKPEGSTAYTENAMFTSGIPSTDKYDISQFDSSGAGTYYLCAVLDNDTTGSNINRNYTIDGTDSNASPAKDEVKVQPVTITAGSASLDDVKWQYQAGASGIPADISGATITYGKVSGVAISYIVTAINYPSYCEVKGYSNATKSDAGTYTATVTIEIVSDKRTDNKMPNPSDGYTYAGEGKNYQYINDYTCTIDLDWTIEKEEIDLSGMTFYYSNDFAGDGSEIWEKYDKDNLPESTGINVKAMIGSTDYIDGVTGATFVAGTDMKGPGTIYFDFEFTLDDNHKPKSGQTTTVSYQMDLTGKQVKVQWQYVKLYQADGVTEWKSNTNVTFMYYQLKLDPALETQIKPYLHYEYYTDKPENGGTLIGTDMTALNAIIDAAPAGMGACDNPVTVYIKPVLSGLTQVNGVDPYVLKFSSSGGDEYKKTTIGDNKDPVNLKAGSLTSITYGGTVSDIADAYTVTVQATGNPLNSNFYTVNLHDKDDKDLGLASAVDFSTLDAGEYKLVFKIAATVEDSYVLTDEVLTFTVKPVELTVPTLKDGVTLTFSGVDQQLASYLQNWDDKYMEFAPNSVHEAYHAKTYKAVIKIKDEYAGNYVFATPASTPSTTKKPVKALVDGEVALPTLSGDKLSATIDWTIEKFVLDTTQKSAWNFAKDGATLSFSGVPASIKALTMGSDPTLKIDVAYFDLDGNFLPEAELKGGNKFQVAAYLDPSSADADDIVFKGQEYNPMISTDASPMMSYTVPKSGAAAFMSSVKDAMTKVYFGLPLWAWLLIALALIILLIIIIVVAKKRRKTKEEREAKKAAKEEEKQRREEERRMQQEKLEAERELARAKQEAEIEKIKAQAQAGMAGAGMATMAMAAQQPAQQQQPQPVQQPVQQVVDNTNNELIKEMREQMAEMRAENRAAREQLRSMQYQQAMPQPMYQPQPVQAAAPAAGSDLMTLMDLKVQMAEMKSAQALAELKTAQAIAEAKGANKQSDNDRQYSQNYPNYGGYPSVNMGYGMQSIPAPQAVMTPYGMLPAPQQVMTPYGVMPAYGYPPVAMLPQPAYAPVQPKKEEEEPVVTATSQTTPSMTMSQPPYCPPGAVMTTTTTIDTSKSMENKSTESSNNVKSGDLRRTAADSADDITFDVDGFYDPLD